MNHRGALPVVAVATVLAGASLLFAGSTAAAGAGGGDSDRDGTTLRFDVVFSPFSYTDWERPVHRPPISSCSTTSSSRRATRSVMK